MSSNNTRKGYKKIMMISRLILKNDSSTVNSNTENGGPTNQNSNAKYKISKTTILRYFLIMYPASFSRYPPYRFL